MIAERPGSGDPTIRLPSAGGRPSGLDATTGAPVGDLVGDYTLLDEIGRGGMGVVYRARQRSLDRVVAVKMLPSSRLASAEQVRRFRIEAQTAAKLAHPNLVKVFDFGECQGAHFFVMEYIAGASVASLLEANPPSATEAARLVMTVARAVEYLHRNGVVHRDLKPSNILIDASGQPYVTDFGVAKIAEDVELTQSGTILGTPHYMSPEQAAGHARSIDERSDVYSLGAILYELLTGRVPFKAETPMDALVQVLERQPPRPRQLRPEIPRDLELICLRCLEKSPERRYPSASELADDLERFLRDEPVEARPARPWERVVRWAAREPALASRVCGIATFYGIQLVNYARGTIEAPLHWKLTGVLAAWIGLSVALQRCIDRKARVVSCLLAWSIVDVASVSVVLLLLGGVLSSLLVVYPLLVVASGLWSRVRFVWYVTAASVASYLVLVADYHLWRPERDEYRIAFEATWDRHAFFVAMLLVMGTIVAHQVGRAQALSRFFRR